MEFSLFFGLRKVKMPIRVNFLKKIKGKYTREETGLCQLQGKRQVRNLTEKIQ